MSNTKEIFVELFKACNGDRRAITAKIQNLNSPALALEFIKEISTDNMMLTIIKNSSDLSYLDKVIPYLDNNSLFSIVEEFKNSTNSTLLLTMFNRINDIDELDEAHPNRVTALSIDLIHNPHIELYYVVCNNENYKRYEGAIYNALVSREEFDGNAFRFKRVEFCLYAYNNDNQTFFSTLINHVGVETLLKMSEHLEPVDSYIILSAYKNLGTANILFWWDFTEELTRLRDYMNSENIADPAVTEFLKRTLKDSTKRWWEFWK